MMFKLSVVLAFANMAMPASAHIADFSFAPERLSFDDLKAHATDTLLIDALSKEGIVSITGIPGFKDMSRNLLAHLHSCLVDMDNQENSFTSEYSDGTVRRTIASVTIPGPGGARPFDYDEESLNCQDFSKDLTLFRKTVDSATEFFAERLTLEMGSALTRPLMNTKDGEYTFDEFSDVVRNGEHLEHFHSYQKMSENDSSDTIEVHTDQGLFIAFTPALISSYDEGTGKPDLSNPMKESEGFFIETSEGKTAMVDFSSEDDLVFMLGDGVNQYVNTKLNKDKHSLSKALRATPHAVKLQAHGKHLARVWYGLMVLPPTSAYSEADEMTYGEIRNLLTRTKNEDIPVGLGCSSTQMRALEGGDDCFEQGAVQCWHRCMLLEDYGLTFDMCTEENHAVKCVNPRDQVSTGENHGDFFPKCTDSVEEVTPYPTIPSYPQDPEVCTAEAFDEFKMQGEYMYNLNLTTDRTNADFYWTPNKDAGTIKGRLAFNGQFGYIAFGFLNLAEDARHKGMNGGHIIMATPGDPDLYSAKFGLDVSTGTHINEFMIDENGSSFRHWYTPVGESDATVTIDDNECFTSLEFEINKIYLTDIDVEGTNIMQWAANPVDRFAGYHSRNRAYFTVEWMTGKAFIGREEDFVVSDETVAVSDETEETDGGKEPEAPTETSGSSKLTTSIMGLAIAFLSLSHVMRF